jgi:arylsulfatase A
VLCPGSGGWSDPKDEKAKEEGFPDIQLYDMKTDIEEQHNLQAKRTGMVRKLVVMLKQIVADGRSTPGRKFKNDIENIDIWKGITPIDNAP